MSAYWVETSKGYEGKRVDGENFEQVECFKYLNGQANGSGYFYEEMS